MKQRARQDAHKPNTIDNHWKILSSVIKNSNFIVDYDLEQTSDPKLNSITIQGELRCLGDIVLDITKELKITNNSHKNGESLVQTENYSYQARIKNLTESRILFRYDAHPGTIHHKCHQDKHHYHDYDLLGKQKLGGAGCDCGNCPIWVGKDSWPHISDVLEDAEDYYYKYLV